MEAPNPVNNVLICLATVGKIKGPVIEVARSLLSGMPVSPSSARPGGTGYVAARSSGIVGVFGRRTRNSRALQQMVATITKPPDNRSVGPEGLGSGFNEAPLDTPHALRR